MKKNMKKRKNISATEIARRKKQSKLDYQIRNIDKIYKENAKKDRKLFYETIND